MNTPDFRALCAELLQPLAEYDGANPYHEHRDLITRARAALLAQQAAPAPVVVPVGECPHCGYEGEMVLVPQAGKVEA
jgi:hypothetical protein